MDLFIYIVIGIVLGICLTIVIKGFMPKKEKKQQTNKKKGKLK